MKHRPTAQEDAAALVATITGFLLSEATKGVITRQAVIETAAATLARFDTAAATMYRAYHKA